MTRSIADRGGNIAAFILVILFNVLANSLPLGGQTTGQVSAKYPSLFVPATYVFSIWGLIYLGLTAFVIYQALPAQRSNQRLASITPLFIANCIANALWLVAWHYDQLVLSALLMIAILITLVLIYRRLDIGRAQVSSAERWLVHMPFSIYTGWITVATIANLSAVQYASGWDDVGVDSVTWTIFKIAVAATIAARILFQRRDFAYVLVICWASAGIAVKQVTAPAVVGAATTAAAVGIMLILSVFLSRPNDSTAPR
ncbi:MAG: tryptophan-rich sensory protein [Gammaproteobacteria bacterium]|nr:tryptophan-rich sensory protein [Gammaproteobacteria bacterium]MBT8443922.1 tryptophan-rich sensory protein [Gammaproteobacteria bacterium]NND36788.1 tryptophan-rich sensory protein [Gammaproteobacteria bacterium]